MPRRRRSAATPLQRQSRPSRRAADPDALALLEQVFDGADSFPNTPITDNGEGGGDRYWGQMRVTIPASALRQGRNTLTLRNTTPWQGSLGIPYILISDLRLE